MEQATKIFNRMTEVEKMTVRGASSDRLDFLGDTSFRVDMPISSFEERAAVMKEVQALCALESAAMGHRPGFDGVTWKF